MRPGASLKPEQTYNFDLCLVRTFNGWMSIEVNGFYSIFRNAIVMDRYRLNGADSILYDGQYTPVVSSQNKAKVQVYGLQGSINLRPQSDFTLYSHVTCTYGKYTGTDGLVVPMDHIPPVFGKTGFSFVFRFLQVDAYVLYNSWKKVKDYNPSGEDNLQYATSEGMPAWYTSNISTTWTIHKCLKLKIAVENLFDRNYRVFSSGISGAGRNLMLKLNVNF